MMQLMQGTAGETFELTTYLDLTTATTIRVRLVRPEPGEPIDKHLGQDDVVTPATGVIAVPLDTGDLDLIGFWGVEAYDESDGVNIPSAKGVFEVLETYG